MDGIYQTALLLVILGLIYLLRKPLLPNAHGFTRLGTTWVLQILPGQTSMTWSIDKYVEKGYYTVHKSLNQPFKMKWWAKDYIILPPRYLPEIKRADSLNLSFFKNLSDAFSLESSVGDLYNTNLMTDVVTKRLNPQLPMLIPLLAEECEFAFDTELHTGGEWKEVYAAKTLSKIMHRVTSRVLIGPELCRNNDYIDKSMQFSDSIFVNGLTLTMVPLGLFRKLGSWVGSFRHRQNLEKAVQIVLPTVKQRLAAKASDTKATSHLDALEWTIDLTKSMPRENNPRRITLHLLHNMWAGSAAPGGLMTQMVYQVLMEPIYLEPLRTEAAKAVLSYGWSEKALRQMPLQDSFIREINRVYPTGSVTCARTVVGKPFRFDDGLVLPTGSCIAIPAMAIQKDPDNYREPLTFDGFRFARLHPAKNVLEEDEHQCNAATVSTTYLAFGYGKHACPGRFYAVRKAKLIFSKLLLEYDMKWANFVTERPPSLSINGQFAPNMEQKVLIRKRHDTC